MSGPSLPIEPSAGPGRTSAPQSAAEAEGRVGEAPTSTKAHSSAGPRRKFVRWLLPLGVLALAAALSVGLYKTRPKPAQDPAAVPSPLVRTLLVQPRTIRSNVIAHGTVTPRTESELVAEVRGRVVWAADALEAGSFFKAGDELLRLDEREHQIAVDRTRAMVQLSESEHRLAAAEAKRRQKLSKKGAASESDLEQFESRASVARASLDRARAELAQAELELERTVVRAPFDGRVRERSVDLGQFVSPGSQLARIYATDQSEVRLPIRTEDLAILDVPLGVERSSKLSIPITLHARLRGREQEWPARLVRSEGEIDRRTRMLNVVARVDDPYEQDCGDCAPLPSGLFVRAEITGRELVDVFVLPTIALRDEDRVLVVDSEQRVQIRKVDVFRRRREDVIVRQGLEAGEEVVVSPLRLAVDGMRVRIAPEATP